MTGVQTCALPISHLIISLILVDRFEQKAPIPLFQSEASVKEGGGISRATPLQRCDHFLVLWVLFQKVPECEENPLADNWQKGCVMVK